MTHMHYIDTCTHSRMQAHTDHASTHRSTLSLSLLPTHSHMHYAHIHTLIAYDWLHYVNRMDPGSRLPRSSHGFFLLSPTF